jgi:hypothetical protein
LGYSGDDKRRVREVEVNVKIGQAVNNIGRVVQKTVKRVHDGLIQPTPSEAREKRLVNYKERLKNGSKKRGY